MIASFASAETKHLFETGKSRKLPPAVRVRAIMRLQQLDMANRASDLRLPSSNRLETLHGDRKGQWSIRVNDQWRVCFRFENGDAWNVAIVDYH